MGLGDFFKKLLGPDEVEIDTSDPNWLALKEEEFLTQEKDVLAVIAARVAQFRAEVKEKLPALRVVDLSQKNVPGRVKVLVQKNADNYIHYVEIFMESLDFDGSLEEVVSSINSVFAELHKKTNVSYQKATYLIGEEMGAIHKSITSLSQDLGKAVPEKLVVTSRTINSIKKKYNESDSVDALIEKSVVRVGVLEKKHKKDIAQEKKRIAELKNSKEYLDASQQLKDHARYEKELSQALVSLKSKIDFKKLGNVFHSSSKMGFVNELKQNFTLAYNGTKLRALLLEAKLDSCDELIARIDTLKKQVKKKPTMVVKEMPIDTHELSVERKQLEKLKNKKDALEASIKEELEAYGRHL